MLGIKNWKQVSLDTRIYYTLHGNIYDTNVEKINAFGTNRFSIKFGYISNDIIQENFDIDIIKHDGICYSYNRELLIPIAMECCDNKIIDITRTINRLSEEIFEYKEKKEKLIKYT